MCVCVTLPYLITLAYPNIIIIIQKTNINPKMSNFETVIYSGDDSIQPKQKEAKKSKPANRVFELRSRHDTPEEAIEELKKYGTYSINKEFETKQGIKVDYRCNQVKRRGPQCASAIHLLYHSTSSSVSLYSTKSNHTHTTINEESTKQGIPEKSKKIIDQLAERGHVTAKQILDNLVLDKQSDPDIFIPTILQINNYKNNKINKDIPSAFNFAELSELLGNSSHEPEDDDIPYVINMQIKVDEEDQPEGPLIKNEQFRFAISTKRLLALASKHAITIQADATYNLVWNNNPVMITGITDKDNHFHPIILAVCTNEEFHDYQFLFESYVKGIHDLGKFLID